MYLVDTSVWAEIFLGTRLGQKAKAILDSGECFALDITLAELVKWCVSHNFDPQEIKDVTERSSNGTLGTSKTAFFQAGMLWHIANKSKGKGRQIGLIDCIIAAAAEENGLVVITKDRHFLHFEEISKEII